MSSRVWFESVESKQLLQVVTAPLRLEDKLATIGSCTYIWPFVCCGGCWPLGVILHARLHAPPPPPPFHAHMGCVFVSDWHDITARFTGESSGSFSYSEANNSANKTQPTWPTHPCRPCLIGSCVGMGRLKDRRTDGTLYTGYVTTTGSSHMSLPYSCRHRQPGSALNKSRAGQ